jgi:hypothetical protein
MNREIMEELGLGKELNMIDAGICPTCGKKVNALRNAKSVQEYGISGMCQDCQDSVFGKD